MSTSSCSTVKRCASSLARSSTSPTSRSSRSASAATTSSDSASHHRVLDDQPFAERLDVAADRGQRRPQLVRDGHQEVPLLLLCLGEPGGHLAEAFGQVADLVRSPHVGDVDVVPALGDPVGRLREREHRASRSGATGTRRARRPRTGRPRARPGAARRARTSPGSGRSSCVATTSAPKVCPSRTSGWPDGEEGLVLARRRELEGDHLLAVDQRLPLVADLRARQLAQAGCRAGRRSARRRRRDARRSPSRARRPAKSGAERPSSIERIACRA